MFFTEHKDDLFLNIVCILILVDHQIVYLFLQIRKNSRIFFQQAVAFGLYLSKVDQVFIGE